MISRNDTTGIENYIKKYNVSWKYKYKEEYLVLRLIRKCKLTTFILELLSCSGNFNVVWAMQYMIKYQPEHLVAYFLGLYPNLYMKSRNNNGQCYAIQCIVNKKMLVFECFINKTTDWNILDSTEKNLAMYVLRYTPIVCHKLIPIKHVLWNQKDLYSKSVLQYAYKYSDASIVTKVLASGLPLCIPKGILSNNEKEYTKNHLRITDLYEYKERCCICLDHYTSFGKYEKYVSRCDHVFHLECVKNLQKCPLCRNKF